MKKKRKRGRPTETQDLLGAGQEANYVAANQMAVELCAARCGQNLPGLAVALGPVLGAGMLERDPDVAKILRKRTQEKGQKDPSLPLTLR